MERDLVFDIGMHNGTDTEFYLDLGYRVVGVEPNAPLADWTASQFPAEVKNGRLVVEKVGVLSEPGTFTLYVSDFLEWSSFHENLGQRSGTFTELRVPCVSLRDLIDRHGVPYFIKIDAEGADADIANQIATLPELPAFASCEDGGRQTLDAAISSGAKHIAFLNQLEAQQLRRPVRRRRKLLRGRFGAASSGPFGKLLPRKWLSPTEAIAFYEATVRPDGQPPTNGWWDIHMSYGDAMM